MALNPYVNAVDAPPSRAWAITPHDVNPLIRQTRGLWVGTGGNLAAFFAHDDAPVTLTNVPAGLLPCRLVRVLATGTTASGLIGLA